MSPKSSNLKSTMPIYAFLALLIVAGGAFYAGIQYQKGRNTNVASSASTTSSAGQSVGGSGFGGGRFGGQRPTFGQVTAISPSSISVQDTRTGSTVTFSITSSTTITNAGQSATASDIQTGNTVAVIASSSDSTQASRILVNPTFGGGGGAGNSGSSNVQTQ